MLSSICRTVTPISPVNRSARVPASGLASQATHPIAPVLGQRQAQHRRHCGLAHPALQRAHRDLVRPGQMPANPAQQHFRAGLLLAHPGVDPAPEALYTARRQPTVGRSTLARTIVSSVRSAALPGLVGGPGIAGGTGGGHVLVLIHGKPMLMFGPPTVADRRPPERACRPDSEGGRPPIRPVRFNGGPRSNVGTSLSDLGPNGLGLSDRHVAPERSPITTPLDR